MKWVLCFGGWTWAWVGEGFEIETSQGSRSSRFAPGSFIHFALGKYQVRRSRPGRSDSEAREGWHPHSKFPVWV
jgi:hypothetical protein